MWQALISKLCHTSDDTLDDLCSSNSRNLQQIKNKTLFVNKRRVTMLNVADLKEQV